MFNRFLERKGLKHLGIHFHTLRHTFSNMLFESHENAKTIQTLMGHKKEQTNGVDTTPSNTLGTAATVEYLQSPELLFDFLYWDEDIWELAENGYPMLK